MDENGFATSRRVSWYWGLLRRWWWLLIIGAVIPALMAGFFVSRQPDFYLAKATLMVGTSLQNPDPQQYKMNLANTLANAYGRLVTEGPLLRAVIGRLGLERGPGQLADQISARSYPEAQLLEIEVVDGDPAMAALIANTLASELIQRSPVSQEDHQQRMRFIQLQLDVLESRIERLDEVIAQEKSVVVTLTSAAELEEARRRLRELETVRSDEQGTYAALLSSYRSEAPNVLTLFEPATEPEGALPHRGFLVIAVAAAAGLALALAGAFVIDLLDDSVRWESVRERSFMGKPVLGALPQVRARRQPLTRELRLRFAEAEAIRNLRTALLMQVDGQHPAAVLVTSPGGGDGKTFTLASLGISLVGAGLRVILVDGDMRGPRLHECFDQPNIQGLSELLDVEADVAKSLSQSRPRLLGTGLEGLRLLPSGRPPRDPTAMLMGDRLGELLMTLERGADLVMIDSPAGAVLPDPLLFLPWVGSVIVLCRHGHTSSRTLRRLLTRLEDTAPQMPVSIVFNGVKGVPSTPYPEPRLSWTERVPLTKRALSLSVLTWFASPRVLMLGENRSGGQTASEGDPLRLKEGGLETRSSLTVEEVAHILGVSRATVRRWCRVGRLPAERSLLRWRIRPEDVRRMVAGTSEMEQRS